MRVAPPHEQDFLDVGRGEPGALEGDVGRLQGFVEVGGDFVFVVGTVQLQGEVYRLAVLFQQVFFFDAGEGGVAQGDLGRLAGARDAGHGGAVVAGVDAGVFFDVGGNLFYQFGVEVVAAQVVVAVAGQYFGHVLAEADDGDVEGAAAEVVDQDVFGFFMVGLVGQGGGGGFVDDARDVQFREPAGLAGGLPLGVREIGGDGDYGLGDRLAQGLLRGLFEPPQDEGGDFLRGIFPFSHGEAHVFAHAPLDGGYGALGVEGVLVARGLAHEEGVVVRQSDYGGQDRGAVDFDEAGTPVLDDGYFGVGGPEVDSDDDVAQCLGSKSEVMRGFPLLVILPRTG